MNNNSSISSAHSWRLNETELKYGVVFNSFHCSIYSLTFPSDFKQTKKKKLRRTRKIMQSCFSFFVFFSRGKEKKKSRHTRTKTKTFNLSNFSTFLRFSSSNYSQFRHTTIWCDDFSADFAIILSRNEFNRRNEDQWKIFSLTPIKFHTVGLTADLKACVNDVNGKKV